MRWPVIMMALNNGILGRQKHAELSRYGAQSDAIAFAAVDQAAIVGACDGEGIRIERPLNSMPRLPPIGHR